MWAGPFIHRGRGVRPAACPFSAQKVSRDLFAGAGQGLQLDIRPDQPYSMLSSERSRGVPEVELAARATIEGSVG